MKRITALIVVSLTIPLTGCGGTSTEAALKKACAQWQADAAATGGQDWSSVNGFPAGLSPSDCK